MRVKQSEVLSEKKRKFGEQCKSLSLNLERRSMFMRVGDRGVIGGVEDVLDAFFSQNDTRKETS